ncbi:hypothetical protein DRE_04143 [Drechslerella stenobrocha 248]|uniref:BTB domain-containing protein n=1 Tax=Drechslerella stenobrocha 248 TaxID=1043628 RepID=W7HRI8_9PEZI|nr:hypothetical protein DRE_04143 [Drechslerella stenobrocha 248]
MDDRDQPLPPSPRPSGKTWQDGGPHAPPKLQPSPRRPPILKGPPIAEDSLLKLLKSQQFSDMTALVGTGQEARVYNLHRNIMCTKSRYFQSTCQYQIQSGSAVPQVQLPEIFPPIFDIVLEWVYGGILVLEAHQPLILSLYRAADFLQIHSLKLQIARRVGKLLKHRRKNGIAINFDGFEVVRGMFEHTSTAGYFSSLRKCTDELALSGNIPLDVVPAQLHKGGGSNGTMEFWMALALSYQKALHATVCSECRAMVSTRTSLDRMCCHS